MTQEGLAKYCTADALCPDWKCKVVRPLRFDSDTFGSRLRALDKAHFNLHAAARSMPADGFQLFVQNSANAALSTRQMSALEDGDEAYAGAKDFFALEKAVEEHLGVPRIIPAHAWVGALHIFCNVAVEDNSVVLCNGEGSVTPQWRYHVENRVRMGKNLVRKISELVPAPAGCGDIDLQKVQQVLDSKQRVSFVLMVCNLETPAGECPVSLGNLRALRKLLLPHAVPIVLDASNITGNAFLLKERDPELANLSVEEIIKLMTAEADAILLSGEDEMLTNTGGVVGVKPTEVSEKRQLLRSVQAEVVEYEGLHTYGGMSGRDMGVFAQGIKEATSFSHMRQRVAQLRYLQSKLLAAGVLDEKTCLPTRCIYVDPSKVLPSCCGCDCSRPEPHHDLVVSLALAAGVVAAPVEICNKKLVRVCIPPRTFTVNHLDYIAAAFSHMKQVKAPCVKCVHESETQLLKEFVVCGNTNALRKMWDEVMEPLTWDMEPWVIRVVEPVQAMTEDQRRQALDTAGHNTFLIKMEDGVKLDLLTDSGTNAQSVQQWAEMRRFPEVGGDSYQAVVDAVRDIYGYEKVLPTHQGRMAEFMVSQSLIKGTGLVVPGNMYFTTTKFHQEFAGATFVDVVIDEAHDSQNPHPFKGNIDLTKLQTLIDKQVATHGSPKMPYISIAGPVNLAGGQPFSMANVKAIRAMVDKYNVKYPQDPIRLVFDATRAVENCEMVKEREPEYAHKNLGDLLLEMCSLFDLATMSSKKDNLVNIGGFFAIRDNWCNAGVYEEALRISAEYDGPAGDTGLSTRNLAALAVGIREMIDPRYMHSRLIQIRKFGKLLTEQGVPLVLPVGGHAVFLDATKFMQDPQGKPLLPREQYVAQSLAAAIFRVSGVRSMERGAVSKGRDKDGLEHFPKLETVRLTIPRRVYTDEHLALAAAQISEMYKKREERGMVPGLKMVYEPPNLRFFQARFAPILN